ncbi:hypothetical protein BHE74_00052484 [Ensete ventricosum]|nr:hypothetical protein GW17_00041677 [Ensete ventricosum]RWW41998.1 hypothetical protein BHE74_00052484 [Ensete ventricosum]
MSNTEVNQNPKADSENHEQKQKTGNKRRTKRRRQPASGSCGRISSSSYEEMPLPLARLLSLSASPSTAKEAAWSNSLPPSLCPLLTSVQNGGFSENRPPQFTAADCERPQ